MFLCKKLYVLDRVDAFYVIFFSPRCKLAVQTVGVYSSWYRHFPFLSFAFFHLHASTLFFSQYCPASNLAIEGFVVCGIRRHTSTASEGARSHVSLSILQTHNAILAYDVQYELVFLITSGGRRRTSGCYRRPGVPELFCNNVVYDLTWAFGWTKLTIKLPMFNDVIVILAISSR